LLVSVLDHPNAQVTVDAWGQPGHGVDQIQALSANGQVATLSGQQLINLVGLMSSFGAPPTSSAALASSNMGPVIQSAEQATWQGLSAIPQA
jgi:hypothetical protein